MKALSNLEGRKKGDKIIKDVKNMFTLNKEINSNAVKNVRNRFRLKKENEANKICRVIKTLFVEENDNYKPIRVDNFWNNKYAYQISK